MIIIVDKNEADVNPEVLKLIQKSFTNVVVANLPHHEYGGVKVTAGDVNIPLSDGSILAIERKTPEDFLSSIANRHVFNQVEVMANNAKYYAVIVTGAFTYGQKDDMCYIVGNKEKKTNWDGISVRAAITAIQLSGCPIIFCPPTRYCQMIAELYTTSNKPDRHQAIKKNRVITFPPVDYRVEFLAQLPGVGLKFAEALLNFSGMMENVKADELGNTYGTLASALHWMTILVQIDKEHRPKGWGAQLIYTQRKFLGLEENQYLAIAGEETVKLGHEGHEIDVTYTVMNSKRYKKEKE